MADGDLRVAVLADTHRRGGLDDLPRPVLDQLRDVDVILHAGDVVGPALLAGLRSLAPVHAVLGNNDHELAGTLPDRLELDLGGVRVAMVHDSGARVGRPARLARWFPEADLVVFGHSHEPVDEPGVGAQRLLNPGSPTQRRRQPHRTMARLTIRDGVVADRRVVTVDG